MDILPLWDMVIGCPRCNTPIKIILESLTKDELLEWRAAALDEWKKKYR